ncbi:MAG TPA: hypothetical protein VM778_03025 [Gemmatimonadota bacterium]|nr:hypothetical protein [Gemmatimonadota bacterium]
MTRSDRFRLPWAGALALALVLACGGGDDPARSASEVDEEGRIVLPPSANAPRGTLPGGGPDTLRPVPDTLAGPEPDWRIEEDPAGRHRAPEEFDLQGIVDAYRRYYTELYYEEGSDVRGGIDPVLEGNAKRRIALDWGYVEVGAWSDMVDDMSRNQQIVLADRIAAANGELAERLHGQAP